MITRQPSYCCGIQDYHEGVWREYAEPREQLTYEMGRLVAASTGTMSADVRSINLALRLGAFPRMMFGGEHVGHLS